MVIIDEGMVVSWLYGRGIMYQLISNRTSMAKWGIVCVEVGAWVECLSHSHCSLSRGIDVN